MIREGEGGAQTVLEGLTFEDKTDLADAIRALGSSKLRCRQNSITWMGKVTPIAEIFRKQEFYNEFLARVGASKERARKIIPVLKEPDECLVDFPRKKIFIIEKKTQRVPGSADEKIAACDYNKRIYLNLLKGLGGELSSYKLEYVYLLSGWFEQDKYSYLLKYIKSVGCHYFFYEKNLDKIIRFMFPDIDPDTDKL